MGNYSAGTVNYPMGTVNYPEETVNFRTEKMNYAARTPNRQEEAISGTNYWVYDKNARVPDSTLPSTSAKINKRKFQEEPPHQIWAKKYDIPLPQEILDQCLEKECNICEIQTSSITTCQQHYQGSKHAKKVAQRIEEIFKNKPDEPKPKRLKSDLSPSITSQAESSLADLAGSMDIPLTPQQDTLPPKEGPFHCTHCNINCQSKTPYEMHLQGKAHLKKVKQQEE